MGPMNKDLRERIRRGEEAIERKRASGESVPQEWEGHLARLKAQAAQGRERASQACAAAQGPRYAPGCLYDYHPGRRVRPVLRCVAHPGCPREVVVQRAGILAEMFSLERLVGSARIDGEAEWRVQRGRAG